MGVSLKTARVRIFFWSTPAKVWSNLKRTRCLPLVQMSVFIPFVRETTVLGFKVSLFLNILILSSLCSCVYVIVILFSNYQLEDDTGKLTAAPNWCQVNTCTINTLHQLPWYILCSLCSTLKQNKEPVVIGHSFCLCQTESSCQTIHMEMCFAYRFIFMQIKLIFY